MMIDWHRVQTLHNELGADDFDEVVELFLEEVSEVIKKLESGPDLEQLGEDLHFLKGSSMGLGFAQFAALCQTGETMSGNGKAGDVDLAEILASFAETKRLFQQELPMVMEN